MLHIGNIPLEDSSKHTRYQSLKEKKKHLIKWKNESNIEI